MQEVDRIQGQGLQSRQRVSGCTCWAMPVRGGLPCLLACAASTAQGEGACPHQVDRIERTRPAVQRFGERVCCLSVLVVLFDSQVWPVAGLLVRVVLRQSCRHTQPARPTVRVHVTTRCRGSMGRACTAASR